LGAADAIRSTEAPRVHHTARRHGGTAAVWPLAARAQQLERMRRISSLAGAADEASIHARFEAFRQALAQLGWTDSRNMRIDYRWGGGKADNIRKHAAELAALAPDVILVTGTASLAAMLEATRTVPIVFGSGFVDSLSRPGGNATGFMQFEYSLSGKWLELLKEIAPHMTRAAIVWDPTLPAGIGQFAIIQSVASSLRVEVIPINTRGASEIERGLEPLPAPARRHGRDGDHDNVLSSQTDATLSIRISCPRSIAPGTSSLWVA